MDRLFDLTDYGGNEPTPREKATATRRSRLAAEPTAAVEAHQEPWCQLRHLRGLHPYFHLVGSYSDVSNCVALCGMQGTKVHNEGVTQMVRCPLCAIAQDILRPE
jgi:hypothetical protein